MARVGSVPDMLGMGRFTCALFHASCALCDVELLQNWKISSATSGAKRASEAGLELLLLMQGAVG